MADAGIVPYQFVVSCQLFVVRRAVFGLRSLVFGLWSLVFGGLPLQRPRVVMPAQTRSWPCATDKRDSQGGCNEPPEVSFPDKNDVDENYVRVMRLLLSSGIYHGIATHDPKMIAATIDFSQKQGIPKAAFEFQMLYGVRRDLQRQLAKDGYNMRVYVPYGKHWYPYFMRRLAERPANIWFVFKNLFKG